MKMFSADGLPPPDLIHSIWRERRLVVLRKAAAIPSGSAEELESVYAAVRGLELSKPRLRIASKSGTCPLVGCEGSKRDQTPNEYDGQRSKVWTQLEKGRTLVFDAIQEEFPGLNDWTLQLEARFRGIAIANLYVARPGASGFPPRYDLQDVLVVQAFGFKRWQVFESQHDGGPGGQACARFGVEPGRLLLDVELGPGDLLVIPRGFVHLAIATSGISVHASLSFTSHFTGAVKI